MAFLKDGRKHYLAVFSNKTQEGEQAGKFSMEEKDFTDVITAARFARVDGITVDPFGSSFTVIPEDYDTISRMITRTTSED